MREPVPAVEPSLPPPAPSLLPRKGLREPDEKFIADLAQVIRAGARPMTGALWLGVSRPTWRKWRQRSGEPYDALHAAIREATAHLEVKLQAELAKRSPGAALRGLRSIRDQDDDARDEPSRRYDKSGVNSLQRAMPHLLERISDDAITDLTPVEQAAREWKEGVIADCGGRQALTHAKLALISSATGSWIILSTIDQYVFALAQTQGLTSKKHRRVWPVVEQRARIAESFSRQLQMIGLERRSVPQTLDEVIASAKAAQTQNGD